MKKNAMMSCCRSEKHIGHMQRSIEVARELSDSFNVTILVDDEGPMLIDVPASVRIQSLPALPVDPNSNVFEFGRSAQFRERIIERRNRILETFEDLKPRVIIIDNFPFHHHRLRGELLPLIERAHNGIYGDSLVVCTTDGIMIDDSANSDTRADKAAQLLDKYFDMVIVQSDPVFARLEEFFHPRDTLQTPVYHAGFVSPEQGDTPSRRTSESSGEILVSAGDGRYGGVLFRAAVEAQRVLWPVSERPMKIVAGPRLPEDEWRDLLIATKGMDGLVLTRLVDNLRAEMAFSRCSVSQCGYNTALNSITTQTPSLFIPCQDNQRREQIARAQRIIYWGGGRLLMPHHLNSASLTYEINQLLQFQPRRIRFDTDGAANAVNLIERAMHLNDMGSNQASLITDGRPPH
jgi:predicted glycosyltransferase